MTYMTYMIHWFNIVLFDVPNKASFKYAVCFVSHEPCRLTSLLSLARAPQSTQEGRPSSDSDQKGPYQKVRFFSTGTQAQCGSHGIGIDSNSRICCDAVCWFAFHQSQRLVQESVMDSPSCKQQGMIDCQTAAQVDQIQLTCGFPKVNTPLPSWWMRKPPLKSEPPHLAVDYIKAGKCTLCGNTGSGQVESKQLVTSTKTTKGSGASHSLRWLQIAVPRWIACGQMLAHQAWVHCGLEETAPIWCFHDKYIQVSIKEFSFGTNKMTKNMMWENVCLYSFGDSQIMKSRVRRLRKAHKVWYPMHSKNHHLASARINVAEMWVKPCLVKLFHSSWSSSSCNPGAVEQCEDKTWSQHAIHRVQWKAARAKTCLFRVNMTFHNQVGSNTFLFSRHLSRLYLYLLFLPSICSKADWRNGGRQPPQR